MPATNSSSSSKSFCFLLQCLRGEEESVSLVFSSMLASAEEMMLTGCAECEELLDFFRGKLVICSSIFRLWSLFVLVGETEISEDSSLEVLFEFVMEETLLSDLSTCMGGLSCAKA
jgi:hypothetical protein